MKFTIFKGRKSPYFYVRFQINGVETNQSLKTTNRKEANRLGKSIWEKAHDNRFEEAGREPPAITFPNLGKVIETYLRIQPLIGIQESTAKANANALRRVVAPGLSKTEADNLSVEVCSKRAIQDFQMRGLGKSTSAESINSDVRQARSVFSKRALDGYSGNSIAIPPSVDEFTKTTLLKTGGPRGYKPIPRKKLQALDDEHAALRILDFAVWAIVSLVRLCGIRNREILHARGSWLTRRGSECFLNIDNRNGDSILEDGVLIEIPPFEIKNGHERSIMIPLDLYEALKPEADHHHIVADGLKPTARYNLIYRKASKFVRKFVTKGSKTTYQLRAEAGSVTATEVGLEAAQLLLGHKDFATTKKHYATYLKPALAITLAKRANPGE